VLTEAGVACLAGTAFGAAGEGHLRLSYANSLENLDLAVQRIADWSRANRPVAARA
jgi:aspartate/methionine/tyrosine aminotransferase